MRRYYEEEMRYLHEAGKAFAQAHPEEAHYLNADSVTDRDPYVERLFEGFAFLTGRIQERLDDEMPQYTEALLELLYPHLLRPIPALSIVAFELRRGLVQDTTQIERGAEVRSEPVGDERAACRFVTTQDVRLQPIHLTEVSLHWSPDETSSARLRFETERGVGYDDLQLSPLRLYFHADGATASMMHLFFTRHVRRVTLSSDDGSRATHSGQQWVQPAGLAAEEGLLPYGPRSFSGFRLLHEYMTFRRKFWFVDLLGFDQLQMPEAEEKRDAFTVEVHFDRPYPEDKRFDESNVRLHCTPVVNLFEEDAEPIRVEHLKAEHRVAPPTRYRKSMESYDVREVVGVEDTTGKRHTYAPLYSFEHRRPRKRSGVRYFSTTRRMGPADTPDIFLTLGSGEEGASEMKPETLSLRIRATNGNLPREELQEGMINQLGDIPNVVSPKNLTRPTLILDPPARRRDGFFWELISHLSLNYRSVADREALTGLLRLYDWTETDANRRRIDGITDVEWTAREIVRRGAVMRGAEVTVEVQDGHFASEGDLCLFGLVLSRFFSRYATINAFIHLAVVTTPSGNRYEWKPETGKQPLL